MYTGVGAIYLSTDGGTTWILSQAPNQNWNSIACSADGIHFLATAATGNYPYGTYSSPGIYISNDGGETWTATVAPATNWSRVACSADGIKSVACVDGGQIYIMNTTPLSPTCETQQGSAGDGGALMMGLVIPNGLDTSAWFEWGTSTNYGNITTPIDIGAGWTNVEASSTISGLSPNVLYHYRVVVTNTLGCTYGSDVAFSFPSIQLNGPAVMTNECHMPFADPGATAIDLSPPPLPLAISAGAHHSLALLTNGLIVGWGYNAYGQINPPAEATNVVAIAAGGDQSMALRTDGSVVAWGFVYGGSPIPETETNIVAIATGYSFDMALKTDGTVIGWGSYNGSMPFHMPIGLTNVVAIAAGDNHSLALLKNGSIVGCGDNSYGQSNIPESATNIIAISDGQFHSLALRADGTIVGWGENSYGQLNVPADATNIVSISAGGWLSMALRADGKVFVFGSNVGGETNVPPAATNVVEISAGYQHCLAKTASGLIIGWGSNDDGKSAIPAELTTNYLPITISGNFNGDSPGTYTLIYSATNNEGNFNQTFRTVVVVDTTPPLLVLPTIPVAEFNNLNGAPVNLNVQAMDLCSGILPVTYTPPSGTIFPIGTNWVWASATDDSGNTSRQQYMVVVVGARGVIGEVLNEIMAANAMLPSKQGLLLKPAIYSLGLASAKNAWLDEMDLTSTFGATVFTGTQAAVQCLTSLSSNRNGPIPQAVLNGWISRLVHASRYLAVAKLNAASKPSYTTRPFTLGLVQVAAGDLATQNKRYPQAIADYQAAWKLAVQWFH
jgi:alpha-tubulin suppressor-like RCC1 family protein